MERDMQDVMDWCRDGKDVYALSVTELCVCVYFCNGLSGLGRSKLALNDARVCVCECGVFSMSSN